MPSNLQQPLSSKLVASGARVATGNSTAASVPMGASYSLILDVTAASGTTPTLDGALQHSPDGGTTWYVIQRFTQMTAAGTRNIVFQPQLGRGEAAVENSIGSTTGAVKQNAPLAVANVRFLWTIGGTNPSFTFAVYLITQPRAMSEY